MKKNNIPFFEAAILLCGEVAVSLITAIVFVIIGKFSPDVIFGLLLGTAVSIINFIILSLLANRALDRVMERRPDGEMDEEEAAEFAAKNQGELQASMKLSFIIRNVFLLGTLVLAFLLKTVFNVIATVVPLLMLRPLLMVAGLIKRRLGNK